MTDLPSQANDALWCAAVVRRHARTFHYASWLLPPEKRRAAYALYAFCRIADDLVDAARVGGAASVAQQLADYESALALTVAPAVARRAHTLAPDVLPPSAAAHAPIFRELRRVLDAYAVPEPALRELLAGVARDVAPARYASWDELALYCEGVASSVGEMCTHVFGVPGDASALDRARRHARTLGVAMQLTNILRDVGEDGRMGRCYLPAADLAAHALSVDEVLAAATQARGGAALARDPRWRAFMAFQVARARALYAEATPGIALLAADARRCAAACATGYAGILDAIERAGYDTLTRRARLGPTRRAHVLWQAWRWAPRADHATESPLGAPARGAVPLAAAAGSGTAAPPSDRVRLA